MTEPTAGIVTDDAETLESFKANALAKWARHANTENWNGQFTQTMRELGYTDAELSAARDAGKTVHTLTITVRTAGDFRINRGYGASMEDTVAREVRQGFNLGRGDSVEVVHSTDANV